MRRFAFERAAGGVCRASASAVDGTGCVVELGGAVRRRVGEVARALGNCRCSCNLSTLKLRRRLVVSSRGTGKAKTTT